MIKRVALIGVGLIGGSLGMALRRKYHISGWGRSRSALIQAKRRGALTDFSTDIKDVVSLADVVVLCVPVQAMANTTQKLLPYLKRGAIVSDVGSVKNDVEKALRKILSKRKDVRFVGAHPLAGSEKSGAENAKEGLFRGATVVLTGKNAIVERLWKDTGARPVLMSSFDHDALLALTSHLPHLLSFALFRQAMETAKHRPIVKSLAAGSFRDMTRIAASDPHVWTGIFQMNHKAIRSVVQNFSRNLKKILSTPTSDLTTLLNSISRTKKSWS